MMKKIKNKKISLIILSIIFLILVSVFIGGNVFATHTCQCPCVSEETGGLVPCGRYSDNPETSWDERQPCTLCHLFLMLKLILEFLLKLALIIVILFIIISGLLFIFSLGSPEMLTRAKSALTRAIAGFAIIFLAWLVIDTAMNVMGWNKGKWYEVACDGGISSFTFSCCGDGKVDKPNSCGCEEMCEPADDFDEFKRINASVVQDFDGNGEIDDGDYVTLQMLCTSNCTLGCVNDPKRNEVGLGCFLSDDPTSSKFCQRGKYFCDENNDRVECRDVYPVPLYDYCCRATEDPDYSISDAQSDLSNLSWERVKPSAATDGSGGTFRCDEVCKKRGKVCIGTAITDDVTTSCYGIKCHSGSNCTSAYNMARIDCRLEYPFTRRDVSGSNRCTNPETYYVGYTSCLCK